MKKLYKKEKKLWPYTTFIVMVSLISSIILFLISFNMLSEIIPANTYTNGSYVIFNEYGLPANASWNVTFNGISKVSNSSTIIFIVQNGSYNFTVSIVNSYIPNPSIGNVLVNDSSIMVNINFKKS